MFSRNCTTMRFMKYLFKTGTLENIAIGAAGIVVALMFLWSKTPDMEILLAWKPLSFWVSMFSMYGLCKLFLVEGGLLPRVEAAVSILGMWLWVSLLYVSLVIERQPVDIGESLYLIPIVYEILMLASILNKKRTSDVRSESIQHQ